MCHGSSILRGERERERERENICDVCCPKFGVLGFAGVEGPLLKGCESLNLLILSNLSKVVKFFEAWLVEMLAKINIFASSSKYGCLRNSN